MLKIDNNFGYYRDKQLFPFDPVSDMKILSRFFNVIVYASNISS